MKGRLVTIALLMAGLTGVVTSVAAEQGYRQVVDGMAVYFGIVPAELVRGHPPHHPEGTMHGGAPIGDNHVMVGLFESLTGERITKAEVTARITGSKLDLKKTLEPMVVAGNQTFGNYFYMPGPGPYQIEVRIRRSGSAKETKVVFTWARS